MFKEIPYKAIEKYKGQVILIVTATNIETEILHKNLEPIDENEHIYKINFKDKVYYLGKFGKYLSLHIQCGTMGSVGVSSSIITIRDSITWISPKITIMIGIAFGINSDDQKIGDVIVAETIVPYDNKKISNGKTTIRQSPVPTSDLLLNKFKNALEWEHHLDSRVAEKIISPIFSGEELINDLSRRKEIEKINPLAKGGEMEGAGLYAAANGKCEWVLVKGICDFADGNKDQDKDKNQRIAMSSAVSLCHEVFSSLYSFESIGLFPFKGFFIDSEKSNREQSKGFKIELLEYIQLIDLNSEMEISKLNNILKDPNYILSTDLFIELKGLYLARNGWVKKKIFLLNKEPLIYDLEQKFSVENNLKDITDKISQLNDEIIQKLRTLI